MKKSILSFPMGLMGLIGLIASLQSSTASPQPSPEGMGGGQSKVKGQRSEEDETSQGSKVKGQRSAVNREPLIVNREASTAQTLEPSNPQDSGDVGVPPQFPGGKAAMEQFIAENLEYPESAAGVTGRVMLQFQVHADGSISNIELFDSPKNTDNPDLIAEAKRVVGLFPKFEPATINGQPAEANFIVPVVFKKGGGKGGAFRNDVNAARSYTDEKGRSVVEPDFADHGAMGLRKFLFRYLVVDPHEKNFDQMAGAKIVLELTIDKEGNTKSVDIESSTCKLLNDKAKTIGKSMPKWKPGTIDGQPAKMKRKLTLVFEGLRENSGPRVVKK